MLYLTNTSVTDASLEHFRTLAKLKVLGLQGTHVTASGVLRLKGLGSLRLLMLKDTAVSPLDFREMRQAMPNIKIDTTRNPIWLPSELREGD